MTNDSRDSPPTRCLWIMIRGQIATKWIDRVTSWTAWNILLLIWMNCPDGIVSFQSTLGLNLLIESKDDGKPFYWNVMAMQFGTSVNVLGMAAKRLGQMLLVVLLVDLVQCKIGRPVPVFSNLLIFSRIDNRLRYLECGGWFLVYSVGLFLVLGTLVCGN